MSEGAPDYCPKCQRVKDRNAAIMWLLENADDPPDWVVDALPKCKACKGSGSVWQGDTHDTFEAECHFCGGSGLKSESLPT